MDKLGSSSLDDQKSVIYPITCLLPGYSFILLGDREFCSKHLATWLLEVGWGYCLRLRKSTYVRLKNDQLVPLQQLASRPGVSIFLQGVNISTTAHKFPFNVAIHYPKEHHGMPIEEGWFILTTLPNLSIAIQTYATRFQLEEMFRDYKSYGFNLELSQLNGSRFDAWFLLLTLVYSLLAFRGISTTEHQQKYLARTIKSKRQYPRYSIVTFGKISLLAGFEWAFVSRLISQYVQINRHKIDCYVRGFKHCNQYSTSGCHEVHFFILNLLAE